MVGDEAFVFFSNLLKHSKITLIYGKLGDDITNFIKTTACFR